MKTEKLSQQVLLEVLTREIETLQKASKEVNRAYPLVKAELDRLERQHIIAQVNTQPLEVFHDKLNRQLSQGVVIPKWVMRSLIGIIAWALLMTGLSVWFYRSSNDYQEQAQYWYEKSQVLDKQLAQPTPDVPKGKEKR
jgi:hypothetical protein